MITVHLDNVQHNPVPTQTQFETWVNQALQTAALPLTNTIHEVCLRIINKEESAYLNETFRHKKGPTNVLSFSYASLPDLPPESLGDLALCAEIIAEEARSQEKKLDAHWAHLTIHGILHLLGYDHIDPKDAKHMEKMEIQAMQQLDYPNPYDENP